MHQQSHRIGTFQVPESKRENEIPLPVHDSHRRTSTSRKRSQVGGPIWLRIFCFKDSDITCTVYFLESKWRRGGVVEVHR